MTSPSAMVKSVIVSVPSPVLKTKRSAPGVADQRVVAGTTCKDVGSAVAGQGVRERVAGQIERLGTEDRPVLDVVAKGVAGTHFRAVRGALDDGLRQRPLLGLDDLVIDGIEEGEERALEELRGDVGQIVERRFRHRRSACHSRRLL